MAIFRNRVEQLRDYLAEQLEYYWGEPQEIPYRDMFDKVQGLLDDNTADDNYGSVDNVCYQNRLNGASFT